MTNTNIYAQVTPNPNTLKFVLDQQIIESGSIDFQNKDIANESKLAKQLFENTHVKGILFGTHFVSVTKKDTSDWTEIAESITSEIKSFIESGEEIISATAAKKLQEQQTIEPSVETDTEKRIKEILDDEIRPAVAMDGGDVQFYSFKNGILTLQLQGACSSCPSATFTLKMGIENRLKEELPDIKEVVQL